MAKKMGERSEPCGSPGGEQKPFCPLREPCPKPGLNKRILSPLEHYTKLKKCSKSINCVFKDPHVKVIFSGVEHGKWSRSRNLFSHLRENNNRREKLPPTLEKGRRVPRFKKIALLFQQ